MSSYIATVREEAAQKGMQEGIEKGIEEGIEKGRLEGIRQVVLKMLRHGMAEDEIADLLEMPLSQVHEIKAQNPH